jgi:CheY-like chemotaxis protein
MRSETHPMTPTPRIAHSSIDSGSLRHSARVLVVEDDELLRTLQAAIFGMEDYEVEPAENGAAALDLLATGHFDLVVTDREMPRMDGVTMIRKIRQNGSQVPIVMVSGSLWDSPLPPDVSSAVAAALPKPAFAAQILAAAAHALKPSRERPRVRVRIPGAKTISAGGAGRGVAFETRGMVSSGAAFAGE